MQEILTTIETPTFNPPDVIILYGPPASGKGTQANMLAQKLNKYKYNHIDFGQAFRDFVTDNIGMPAEIEKNIEAIKHDAQSNEKIEQALYIYETMKNGKAIEPKIVWKILKKTVTDVIQKNERLIIEGIGRTIEDSFYFSEIVKEAKLTVALFHLCLTENDIIQRAVHRWYSPNSKISFPSFASAKKASDSNQEPYQRIDDTDVKKIRSRYKELYEEIYAKVLSTLQTECLARLFIIDGSDNMEKTFIKIIYYLDKFYN